MWRKLFWFKEWVESAGDGLASIVPATTILPSIRQGVLLIADRLDESEGGFKMQLHRGLPVQIRMAW